MTTRAAPRRLLVSGVGLCFTLAFLSALPQVRGLLGPSGIAPVTSSLQALSAAWGPWRAVWAIPSVLWFGASDAALWGLCVLGALAGGVALCGFCPRWALLVAWVLHVSLTSAGSVFWHFQWDALLNEAGFLAVLLAPPGLRPQWAVSPSWPSWVLVRLLLLRLMVASGAVKLLSGDVTWRNLSALRYHFWTQPLPTPLGIWVAEWPPRLLDVCCGATLLVELLAPLCVFGPRPVRRAGALCLAGLQLVIALTGNYGFFNVLSVVLLLSMLDDRDVGPLGRFVLRGRPPLSAQPARWPLRVGAGVLAVLGLSAFLQGLGGPEPLAPVLAALAPLDSINRYGLFAVMTTGREDIRVEVSEDGEKWVPLRFRDKPDDAGARWVAPHMPRLDWQMWFAALGSCRHSTWFLAMAHRLLESDAAVWGLLASSAPSVPPRFVASVRRQVLPPVWGTAWPAFGEGGEPFCPTVALQGGRLVPVEVGPPGFEPGTNRL